MRPYVGAHDRLHVNALGTIRTEHADLGAALIPKDGELLGHLKPVSSSITYHLLAPLRARHLGRNGRPSQLVRGRAGMARGALSMAPKSERKRSAAALAAQAAPAPEVEAAKDQALIDARSAAVAAVARALRSAATALRVQA